MAEQVEIGDLVTYHGIAVELAMSRCVVTHFWKGGILSLRFPDGRNIGCLRSAVTKIIAPQYEPDF